MPSRLVLPTVLALAATLACSSKTESADSAAAAPAPAGAGAPSVSEPTLADISREQFAQLRWLEGTWRGEGPGQAPFYERYDVADDTTILMQSFTDSTLTRVSEESRVVLTGGHVLSVGSRDRASGAVRMDANSIDFVPVRSGYTFSWRRGGSPDEWIAVIGASGDRTYTMRRWRPR